MIRLQLCRSEHKAHCPQRSVKTESEDVVFSLKIQPPLNTSFLFRICLKRKLILCYRKVYLYTPWTQWPVYSKDLSVVPRLESQPCSDIGRINVTLGTPCKPALPPFCVKLLYSSQECLPPLFCPERIVTLLSLSPAYNYKSLNNCVCKTVAFQGTDARWSLFQQTELNISHMKELRFQLERWVNGNRCGNNSSYPDSKISTDHCNQPPGILFKMWLWCNGQHPSLSHWLPNRTSPIQNSRLKGNPLNVSPK